MKICLECAEGGHLDEMLAVLPAFSSHEIFFVTTKAHSSLALADKYKVYFVRRERNVRTKPGVYFFELFYMLKLFVMVPFILLHEKPQAVVSTGGGATIPLYCWGKLLDIVTIYISSLTRTEELSGTGKIVYPLADVFLVQWETLCEKYPKSKYWGKVI